MEIAFFCGWHRRGFLRNSCHEFFPNTETDTPAFASKKRTKTCLEELNFLLFAGAPVRAHTWLMCNTGEVISHLCSLSMSRMPAPSEGVGICHLIRPSWLPQRCRLLSFPSSPAAHPVTGPHAPFEPNQTFCCSSNPQSSSCPPEFLPLDFPLPRIHIACSPILLGSLSKCP